MQWISTKDKLPEIGEEVLVCDFAGNIRTGHRRQEGRSASGSEWSLQGYDKISVAAETNHIEYWTSLNMEIPSKVRERYEIALVEASQSDKLRYELQEAIDKLMARCSESPVLKWCPRCQRTTLHLNDRCSLWYRHCRGPLPRLP